MASRLYFREHKLLRQELHHLKNCQVLYLGSSITATGIYLGAITPFADFPAVFLAPLILLIPAWSIFLDKARTISRIVGYYRIIETSILTNKVPLGFVGWENALQKFRDNKNQEDQIKDNAIQKIKSNEDDCSNIYHFFRKTIFNPSEDYWSLVSSIFFYLCLLCLGITIVKTAQELHTFLSLINSLSIFKLFINLLILLLGAGFFIMASIKNFDTLFKLKCGKHSYVANEEFWKEILRT